MWKRTFFGLKQGPDLERTGRHIPNNYSGKKKSWLFVSIARKWSQDCWKINPANASGCFRVQNAGHLFSQVYSCISLVKHRNFRALAAHFVVPENMIHTCALEPICKVPLHGVVLIFSRILQSPKKLYRAPQVRGISVNNLDIHSCVNFLDCSVRWTWKNRAGFGKEQRKAG